jgi:hypothetical protein
MDVAVKVSSSGRAASFLGRIPGELAREFDLSQTGQHLSLIFISRLQGFVSKRGGGTEQD